MSLADDLALAKLPANERCKLGDILLTLDEPDRLALIHELAVPSKQPGRLSDQTLASVLRANEILISDSTVRDHRRGTCRCCQ